MPEALPVDWTAVQFEQLSQANQPDSNGFRPCRGEFSTYWKKGRIAREVRSHVGHCWFGKWPDGRLAGYITLLADSLKVEDQLLEAEDVRYKSFPAIKIGLLAVDMRTKGLGTALVEWAFRYTAAELCPRLGARFMTVDALFDPDKDYDTSPFYEKFGFTFADGKGERIPGQPFRTMYFDLKPILDVLATAAQS